MRFDWVGLGWIGLDCSSWYGWSEEGEGEGEKSCRVGGLSGVGGPLAGKRRQVEREGEFGVGVGMGWDGMGWYQVRGREWRARSVFQVRSGKRVVAR